MSDDVDLNAIRRLDGGLLLVFRELLVHRRATMVARRLGLSQSAVSHALGRLRDLFGDPLFIRLSHGLEPTRRAIELGPKIEALIALAGETVAAAPRFDPARARRRFRLAAPSSLIATLGPDLIAAFLREAPRSAFVTPGLLVDLAVAALRRGEVDLALGQFARLPPDLVAETLYEDRYCVIARRDHPTIRGGLDLETYARTPHVFIGDPQVSRSGQPYDPAEMAQAYGVLPEPDQVRAVAYVPIWETAMMMVATSDAIADCAGRLARRYADRLGLQILDAPYEDAAMPPVKAVRRGATVDPGVDWLLETLRRVVREGEAAA